MAPWCSSVGYVLGWWDSVFSEHVSLEIKGPCKDGDLKCRQSLWGSASSCEPCLGLGLGLDIWEGGQGWYGAWEGHVSLEGFVLQEFWVRGSSCFQRAPEPVPMEVSLMSKHVVMAVWQEQAGWPVCALHLTWSQATVGGVHCVQVWRARDPGVCHWCLWLRFRPSYM